MISDKGERVYNYHQQTLESLMEILGATGLSHPMDLRPWHIMRRVSSSDTLHYGEIFEYIERGSLLEKPYPKSFDRACSRASAMSFESAT